MLLHCLLVIATPLDVRPRRILPAGIRHVVLRRRTEMICSPKHSECVPGVTEFQELPVSVFRSVYGHLSVDIMVKHRGATIRARGKIACMAWIRLRSIFYILPLLAS